MGIFFFVINSILLFMPAFYSGQQCYPRNPLRSLLWGTSIVLSLISILELILGSLGLLNTLNLFIGSLAIGLSSFAYLHYFPLKAVDSDPSDGVEQISALNQRGILALIFIGTVLSVPIQGWLIEYCFQLHRVHPLTSWDVVTYHLPNAVDYLQTGSLWTMRGSFSQYPGGNELLNIWSLLPLKNDAIIGINSFAFISIILLACIQFLITLKIFRFSLLYAVSGILIFIFCFLQADFQRSLFAFGQNDLSLACVEVLVLWAFMECQRSPLLQRHWVLLGALLGIGIGIKPNGLYYFIGFIVLIGIDAFQNRSLWNNRLILQFLKRIALVSVFAFLWSGFWYIRNLIKLGSIFQSSILDSAFTGTIFNNLFNRNLYVLDDTNITLFSIILINFLGWIILWWNSQNDRKNFATLLGFQLLSIISFIITPYSSGFWAGGEWIFKTQLRYGLTLIPISLIIGIFIISGLVKFILSGLSTSSQNRISAWMKSLHRIYSFKIRLIHWSIVFALLLLCLIQSFTYVPPQGLPNFESILFLRDSLSSKSRVYQWIQQNVKDQKIYTIALRPYGLYNFPFSNRVIYGGDSEQWNYQNALDILKTEQPNYIAISRAPFNGQFPIALPDLLKDTEQFELVYGDPLAAVFQVKP